LNPDCENVRGKEKKGFRPGGKCADAANHGRKHTLFKIRVDNRVYVQMANFPEYIFMSVPEYDMDGIYTGLLKAGYGDFDQGPGTRTHQRLELAETPGKTGSRYYRLQPGCHPLFPKGHTG
jgi:hypothetical protein